MPTRPPLHVPLWQLSSAENRPPEDRRSACARGYDRTWQKLRLAILAANPLCVFCAEEGRLVPATDVDHIRTIAEAPRLRLDPANLRPLCKSCHARRTATDVNESRHGPSRPQAQANATASATGHLSPGPPRQAGDGTAGAGHHGRRAAGLPDT